MTEIVRKPIFGKSVDGKRANDGYRCELYGTWIEHRDLGKVLVVTTTTESAATSSPPHHRLLLDAGSSMLAIFTGKFRSSRHEPHRTDAGGLARCKAGGTAITAVKLPDRRVAGSPARPVLATM